MKIALKAMDLLLITQPLHEIRVAKFSQCKETLVRGILRHLNCCSAIE